MLHFDTRRWVQEQFGDCMLGDLRRTKRLIQMAEQIANNPAASLPDQMETWSDLKAAYRLFDQQEVTFQAIASPHWRQTRRQPPGRYLVIGDTTELNFGGGRTIAGAGPTGNGIGRGFLLHTGLLVNPATRGVLGVAAQTVPYRPAKHQRRKKETASQRMKRPRESEVWGRVIDEVGSPPEGVEWVHVFDRGGDNFEAYCHLVANRSDWVVRASKKNREIVDSQGQRLPVSKFLKRLPLAGVYFLELRARHQQAARTAEVEVRIGQVQVPAPRYASPYVKRYGIGTIAMSVVWVREVNPAAGVEPIEWILFTSLPVRTFEDAWQVIEYYEMRWLIEEYHKALKTGCSVTRHELRSVERLEPLVGLLAVVAVRLLALKSAAHADAARPARTVVPALWLAMLKAARKGLRRVHDLAIGQFYRELAKLGGFLGRKHDGEPGWITIWRGWEKLNALVRGAELAHQLKKCG